MKKFMIAAALAAVVALPAMALAQGACANVAGKATLSPALTGTPNTGTGAFGFSGTNVGTCAGASVWSGITSTGTFLPGSSCSGNVHMGSTNGGANFQGVCVGSTCDGGAVLNHAMSYQLVFDAATVSNALANCPSAPVGSGKGITSASFIGAYESQAIH